MGWFGKKKRKSSFDSDLAPGGEDEQENDAGPRGGGGGPVGSDDNPYADDPAHKHFVKTLDSNGLVRHRRAFIRGSVYTVKQAKDLDEGRLEQIGVFLPADRKKLLRIFKDTEPVESEVDKQREEERNNMDMEEEKEDKPKKKKKEKKSKKEKKPKKEKEKKKKGKGKGKDLDIFSDDEDAAEEEEEGKSSKKGKKSKKKKGGKSKKGKKDKKKRDVEDDIDMEEEEELEDMDIVEEKKSKKSKKSKKKDKGERKKKKSKKDKLDFEDDLDKKLEEENALEDLKDDLYDEPTTEKEEDPIIEKETPKKREKNKSELKKPPKPNPVEKQENEAAKEEAFSAPEEQSFEEIPVVKKKNKKRNSMGSKALDTIKKKLTRRQSLASVSSANTLATEKTDEDEELWWKTLENNFNLVHEPKLKVKKKKKKNSEPSAFENIKGLSKYENDLIRAHRMNAMNQQAQQFYAASQPALSQSQNDIEKAQAAQLNNNSDKQRSGEQSAPQTQPQQQIQYPPIPPFYNPYFSMPQYPVSTESSFADESEDSDDTLKITEEELKVLKGLRAKRRKAAKKEATKQQLKKLHKAKRKAKRCRRVRAESSELDLDAAEISSEAEFVDISGELNKRVSSNRKWNSSKNHSDYVSEEDVEADYRDTKPRRYGSDNQYTKFNYESGNKKRTLTGKGKREYNQERRVNYYSSPIKEPVDKVNDRNEQYMLKRKLADIGAPSSFYELLKKHEILTISDVSTAKLAALPIKSKPAKRRLARALLRLKSQHNRNRIRNLKYEETRNEFELDSTGNESSTDMSMVSGGSLGLKSALKKTIKTKSNLSGKSKRKQEEKNRHYFDLDDAGVDVNDTMTDTNHEPDISKKKKVSKVEEPKPEKTAKGKKVKFDLKEDEEFSLPSGSDGENSDSDMSLYSELDD
eukprot:augustus_masked-scaffold_58-processed-gene-0.8-mRNA-1 protein AED:0.44 eAED:1.00 QI:0/-1/0/1/-1/1/1/0/916